MTLPTAAKQAVLQPTALAGQPTAAADSPWTGIRWLIPAGLLLILWMIWISASGGYSSDVWYPSALGACALAVATMIFGKRRLPSTQAARVALLAFAALVALTYLSILWAASPGSALAASNLLLLYLTVAWVFAVLPWTPRTLAALMGLWALGICAFCAAGLLRAHSASSLDSLFVNGRYSTPLQYANATAALAVMGMWPALILSARRELPIWLRAVYLAAAVFLAEFAFLPQSRAALVGLIVTVPVALAASSDRFRLLCRMAIVGGGLAIAIPRTVDVDNAINAAQRVAPVLDRAADAMLLTSAVALVVGALLALAENRFTWRPAWSWSRATRNSERSSATARTGGRRVAVAAVLLIAVAGAVAVAPAVVRETRTVIRNGDQDAGPGPTRLTSVAPEERLDYARVALHLFSTAPILGVGAGNFGFHYDALRRFPKHSMYTHDLALRALSETGLVGLALMLTLIGAIAFGLLRAAREVGGLGRACAVGALVVAVYFLVHASLDWLDEFPALAAPALAFPMAAMAQRRGSIQPFGVRDDATPRIFRQLPRVARRLGSGRVRAALVGTAALVAGLAVFLALSGPYLATRYEERAFATFATRPQGALNDLKRAETLNPLSVDPIISEGTIALYLAEPLRAQAAFQRAVRREDDWYPRLEIALLDAQAGRFAAATSQLNAVSRLDVDDPAIAAARTMVAHRQRINPARFNQLLLVGAQADIFGQQNIK